ncbi:peptidyl-prolyl cis-trans isomerase B-like [Diadema antillarum]|uniref:peptidyl-prolyl cis-trans isomerase B-like n=1 Tax=Diadema antillarum TaxID=105358 RepID=UPI003A8A6191
MKALTLILLMASVALVAAHAHKRMKLSEKGSMVIASVFSDTVIRQKEMGRHGLLGKTLPKSTQYSSSLGSHLKAFGYDGSKFNFVTKDFMIQGEDVSHGDSTDGGKLVATGSMMTTTSAELLQVWLLSMAGAGRNMDGSYHNFVIATKDTSLLDREHIG